MFLSETHLPQLLAAEDYTSEEQFAREVRSLFEPGWHLVGTLAQLPKEGDYFTLELLGQPIIVWRSGGTVQSFLNVCPHRFSRITGHACGNAGERLRCQYHGWEFDKHGTTRKIPDARSFKPMTKGALGLTGIRTETVGQLIFASFAEDGPDLAASIGPGYEVAQQLCGSGRHMFHVMEIEVPANWKTKIENSVESYHMDMIHMSTFGPAPSADNCVHEMAENWTTFATTESAESKLLAQLDRLIHKLAGVEVDREYKHWLIYPTLMFAKMRLYSWAETIVPIAPGRMCIRTFLFCNPGQKGGLRQSIVRKLLSRFGRSFLEKVAHEDASVLPEMQRGLEAPEHPSRGVVSIREERCFHFQEYIVGETRSPGVDAMPAVGLANRLNGQCATAAHACGGDAACS